MRGVNKRLSSSHMKADRSGPHPDGAPRRLAELLAAVGEAGGPTGRKVCMCVCVRIPTAPWWAAAE